MSNILADQRLKQERLRYERWMRLFWGGIVDRSKGKMMDAEYVDTAMQVGWEVWRRFTVMEKS